VIERSGFGSRVAKYQHCFCNTEFSGLKFTLQELAVVCELLLRGAQTPGELRARAARMTPFADSADVESALETLAGRPEGPLVVRLAREPGRREARFAQLFTGAPTEATSAEEEPAREAHTIPAARRTTPAADESDASHAQFDLRERLERLEREVRDLRASVEQWQAEQSQHALPAA